MVKRLKESDILVAIDGEVFLDGPVKLIERFSLEVGDQAKWLLLFGGMENYLTFCLPPDSKSIWSIPNRKHSGHLSNFPNMSSENFLLYENFEIQRRSGKVYVIF